jgi:hypothetical protein
MRTLATDVSRPFPRDENRLVTVLAQFPFVRESLNKSTDHALRR